MAELRSLQMKLRPHRLFWLAYYLVAKPLTFLRLWAEQRAIDFLSGLVAVTHERRDRAVRRRAARRRFPLGGLNLGHQPPGTVPRPLYARAQFTISGPVANPARLEGLEAA